MATSPTAVTAVAFPIPKAARPRRALIAGLAFLEGSADPGWSARGVRDWFDQHLVEPGHMRAPAAITEPGAGRASLLESDADPLTSSSIVPRLVAGARLRTITALRGLNASPTDDRFLSAAIFAGRVQRLRGRSESYWVPQPEPTAPLSGIVLSLFAVDVLSHRDEYEKRLSVCDICDRITFQDGALRRTSCPAHLPPLSGMSRRALPSGRGNLS
jgi:hypothetical protein